MQKKRNIPKKKEKTHEKFNFSIRPNYDKIYYYNKSNRIYNLPCYNLDMDQPSDSWRMDWLQSKKLLNSTEKRLECKLLEANKTKNYINHQWVELAKAEELFMQHFLSYNQFITSNYQKALRAKQIINNSVNLREERNNAILKTDKKIQILKEVIKEITENIGVLLKFEHFIERVKEEDNFKSKMHVIQCYLALEESKRLTVEKLMELMEEFIMFRNLGMDKINNGLLEILRLQQVLSKLRLSYDDAHYATINCENILRKVCTQYEGTAEKIALAKDAIHHIYDALNKRSSAEKQIHIDNEEKRLISIKTTMRCLRSINERLVRLINKGQERVSIENVHSNVKTSSKKIQKIVKLKVKEMDESIVDRSVEHPMMLEEEKWQLANTNNFKELYISALKEIAKERKGPQALREPPSSKDAKQFLPIVKLQKASHQLGNKIKENDDVRFNKFGKGEFKNKDTIKESAVTKVDNSPKKSSTHSTQTRLLPKSNKFNCKIRLPKI